MSAAQDLLLDAVGRAPQVADWVVDGLTDEVANTSPGGVQNSISWLLWHAARQQDHQVAALAGTEQVWTRAGWETRFGLDLPTRDIGFGHTAEQASLVRVSDVTLLTGYLADTVQATEAYVRDLDDAALAEVIDRSYDPPVTRGARLVSVIDDTAQHLGQAAYARTLVESGWHGPY